MPELIARPESVTVEWLTDVLRHAGVLGNAGAVCGFVAEPVGTGQMGDSVRYHLTLDGEAGSTPPTVVAKFTAADERSRLTGITMRTYEVEVRFYQQLVEQVGVTTPNCLFADVRLDNGDFVIVMDDLAPADQGDQIAGCSVDQASLVLGEAARLHAPLWGSPRLVEYDWLDRTSDDSRALGAALLPQLWEGFAERYADRLDAQTLAVGERFAPHIGRYLRQQPEPWTVQHGDFRLDNMLFDPRSDGQPLTVVDWQTVVHGPGLTDVAYFLGAGLSPDDRAANERDLLAEYYAALCSGGVEGYSFDDCWLDYRRYVFSGYLMAVGASMMVEQTARGDEMFLTMADRHAAQITALESQAVLEAG